MTIGNHEWDFGQNNLYNNLEGITSGNVPVVCANVVDINNPSINKYMTNYTIKYVNDIKVGIFGLTVPVEGTKHENLINVTLVGDIINISREVTKKLREEEHCDVVILLSHLGVEDWYQSYSIAENFDGIDLIIDGHSHTVIPFGHFRLNNDKNSTIVQTGTAIANVGLVDLMIDENTKKVVGKRARLLGFSDFDNIPFDQDASDLVDQALFNVSHITSSVIGTCEFKIPYDRNELRLSGGSMMGTFIAASFKVATGNSDFAIVPGANVRTSFSIGEIKYGDAITILPYGNIIRVYNITGRGLKDAVAFGTRLYQTSANPYYPHIAGLNFTIDISKEWNSTDRIINMKRINLSGEYIDDVKDDNFYEIAFGDNLLSGSGLFPAFTNLPKLRDYERDVDCFISFIKDYLNGTVEENAPYFKASIQLVTGIARKVNLKTVVPQVVPSVHVLPKTQPKFLGDNNAPAVNVSGTFFSLGFTYNQGIGPFKPIYDYKIIANKLIGSDIEWLNTIGFKNASYINIFSISYLYLDEFQNQQVNYSQIFDLINEQANEQSKPQSNKCPGTFEKLGDDGECGTNIGFVVVFVLMILFAVLVIVLIGCLISGKNKRTHEGIESDIVV